MNLGKLKIISITVLLATASVLLIFYGVRVFVCDRFVVEGQSMSPTLENGQAVYVNKLLMGSRIYTDFNFDSHVLRCFRMPGIRDLRVGDIAVFNYPYSRQSDKIRFTLDYVYVKRCIAKPGDSLSVINGFYVNSNYPHTGIPESAQRELASSPEDALPLFDAMSDTDIPYFGDFRNSNGIYVPGKGDTVLLDTSNLKLYARLIEYESVTPVSSCSVGMRYVFRENYYFFAGDNVMKSHDSRHFGLVPESYVVGVVNRTK